jgi:hypothetical protein
MVSVIDLEEPLATSPKNKIPSTRDKAVVGTAQLEGAKSVPAHHNIYVLMLSHHCHAQIPAALDEYCDQSELLNTRSSYTAAVRPDNNRASVTALKASTRPKPSEAGS